MTVGGRAGVLGGEELGMPSREGEVALARSSEPDHAHACGTEQ